MPDWVNILLRSVTLVFILFFFTKWLGKKHFSKLNIFDYIHGVVIGGTAAILTVQTDINFFHGVIALFIWFIIPFIFHLISIKSKTIRDFVQGKSTVIIQNGKILEDNLKKESFTTDDLLQRLRQEKIFTVTDVEFAVLESTGNISVLPKSDRQALTAKDLNLTVPMKQQPQTVIMDGEILLEPLANQGLSVAWLTTELAKLNMTKENVFLGQIDSDKQLTVDLYDDTLPVQEPMELPLLLVTLEKAAADLQLFSLATENETSKQLYTLNYERLQQVIELVRAYLK